MDKEFAWIFEALKEARERMPRDMRPIKHADDGVAFAWGADRYIIVSGNVEADGRRWLHASISHKSRMPTYEELQVIRKVFIGEERKSIQVFPPKGKYVNIHPYCLHLFASFDDDPLPEFSALVAMEDVGIFRSV